MTSIWDRSATAASNTSTPPAGFPADQAPSLVAPQFRAEMAYETEFVHSVVAGGTADALTVTYTNVPASLTDGMEIHVRAAAANTTTTPTLNVNSLGAKTITKLGGTALAAGDIAGDLHELTLRYNLANTRWELLNPAIHSMPVLHQQVFTASGTFTTPSGTLSTTLFKFTLVGGGGGGGGGAASGGSGSGGGAGATAIYSISDLTASLNCTVTIGAAANGGASGASDGSAGNSSSVVVNSTTITAAGGGAGNASASAAAPIGGKGGGATNGTINITGGDGSPGQRGTGSDLSNLFPSGGNGGASSFGGGGRGGPSGNDGSDASAYGAGGGGGGPTDVASAAGGKGAQGIVIVEWVL